MTSGGTLVTLTGTNFRSNAVITFGGVAGTSPSFTGTTQITVHASSRLFLGLDWEPACLDFHRTERTVATVSHWQVRQPIYSNSVGRWRNYEKHLAPLLAALNDSTEVQAMTNTTTDLRT